MKTEAVNYETLSKINDFISSSKDLGDVTEQVVRSLTEVLELKGCALMLVDRQTEEFQIAAAHGLSQEYLSKGPIYINQSIAQPMSDGPIAIYDTADDPRLQYPEAAQKEGIASILCVPVVLRGNHLGSLRLYTAEKWEFDDRDLIFTQAVAEIIALVIDNLRMYKGLKSSIDVLKVLRPVIKPTKRTLYE